MSFSRTRRPLTEEEKSSDMAKAHARALEILAAQELCSGELYERLCRRYTEQAAAAAVAEMVELDYVNDERYAEARAHALLCARKSRRAAADFLRRKGLTKQQTAAALDAVYSPDENGEDPEREAVSALIETRYRAKLNEGRRDLVVSALMRRGFGYRVVLEAVRAAEKEESIRNSEFGIRD